MLVKSPKAFATLVAESMIQAILLKDVVNFRAFPGVKIEPHGMQRTGIYLFSSFMRLSAS